MKIRKDIKKLLKERNKGVIIDLGCGENKTEGAIGIDVRPLKGVDIVWDLEKIPYPLPDECAHLLIASHIVEHLKPWLFIDIMNEWWRILKPDGKLMISTPYANSPGFWQDPTHIKGFSEISWAYFDPFPPKDLVSDDLYSIYKPKPWKIDKNYWNVLGSLEVSLIKRREDPSYYKKIY